MHDIKRELLVVCPRIVHAKVSVLRRQHRRFTEDRYTAFAKQQSHRLRATSGRSNLRFVGVVGIIHIVGLSGEFQ